MDSLDDIFAPVPTNARAGGKFQPKLKQRLRKGTPASAPSLVSCDVPNSSSLTPFGVNGTSEEPLAEVAGTREDLTSIDGFHEGGGAERTNGVQDKLDGHSDTRISESEVDFVRVDMDHLIDSSRELSSVLSTGLDTKAVVQRTSPADVVENLDTVLSTGLDTKAVVQCTSPADVVENLDTVLSTGLDTKAAVHRTDVGKSATESVDIFSELEYLDDFVPQTTTDIGNVESQSQSKVDLDDKHVEKFLTSCGADSEVENPILPSETETRPVEAFSAQAHCSIDLSEFTICDVVPPQTGSDYVEVPIHDGRSETEVVGTSFDFDTCEATGFSGQRGGKFKPRPNLRKGKDNPNMYDHQAEVGSSLPSEAEHFVSSNNECAHNGPISEFPREDVLNCASARLDSTLGSMPEIQRNEEPPSFREAYSQGAVCGEMPSEDDPGNKVSETGPVKNLTESNHLRKCKRSSTTSGEVEGGKSSRQLRKRLRQILDEPVDEVQSVDDPTYEPPTASNRDEDEDNDDEHGVNNTSRKRKVPRKVKEPLPGNEEPVRKGKRGKKASDESTKEPPRKKFSHSSRRNKRKIDKALLDIPEDEIDPQRLPIRDLILLAEHRERMMIKDSAKQKTPQTNQSADDSFREDARREEEMFSSEHGQYSDEDQPCERVQPTSVFVNYQTYMDKKPGIRWSKLETELFYEAVQQFGTDFTMIQKLFPNRTRSQVKSKFKREERQHPLRLSEAAMNRAKDHTHFEFVIEQLQQAAAAKQESCANDSVAISGEEETEDANDVATKPEQNDEAGKEQEADVVEVQNSPLKSDKSDDDDDDDLDKWNQYNYV